MADQIYMKALKTFYGTGGYIPAGADFYTTSENLANQYYAQGVAVFEDGTRNIREADLKLIAKERVEGSEDKTEFKTSEMERNVTSMANPINLKISVLGVNPEDLNVEVVRDEEAEVETRTVEAQQGEYPAEKQQLQPQETQQQPQAQNQQNEQPQSQQLSQEELEYQRKEQERQAQIQQSSQQSQNQSVGSTQNEGQASSQNEDVKAKEQELLRQLKELRAQNGGGEYSQTDSQSFNQAQAQSHAQTEQSNQEAPKYDIRHVGGGWYELQNGERVQGKEQASARAKELNQMAVQNQGEVQETQTRMVGSQQFPNPDKVRQANSPAEDGSQLNAQAVGRAQGNGADETNSVNRNENVNNGGAFVGQSTGQSGNTSGSTSGGNTSGNTGGGTGGNSGQGSGGNTGQ